MRQAAQIMKLTKEDLIQRHNEFPKLLIHLGYNNVIVHRVIDLYVHGAIATKEEAYCQIIIELAKTYDELMERMTNEAIMRPLVMCSP